MGSQEFLGEVFKTDEPFDVRWGEFKTDVADLELTVFLEFFCQQLFKRTDYLHLSQPQKEKLMVGFDRQLTKAKFRRTRLQ